MAHYLDTSAAVKLVVEEAGSKALRNWIATATSPIVSSDLLRTEPFRTIRRGAPAQGQQARALLDAVTPISISTAVSSLYREQGGGATDGAVGGFVQVLELIDHLAAERVLLELTALDGLMEAA